MLRDAVVKQYPDGKSFTTPITKCRDYSIRNLFWNNRLNYYVS